MNDEIKEILDKLQKVANRETASRNALMEMKDKDYQLLLDYITKLQEENEFLKLNNPEMNATIYKSRCEKAIEKLESIRIFGLRFGKTLFSTLINETIDILNGGDEE